MAEFVNGTRSLGSRNILVIDDDPYASDLVRVVLSRDGFAVESLADGKLAKDQLEQAIVAHNVPALVILEASLPFCDGFEILRHAVSVWQKTYGHLRCPDHPPSLRAMFLASKARDNDIVRGLSLGALDYLAKPFSSEVLRAKVRAALRCEWQP